MQNDIFQKIENAPKPSFENILSKSFDLFKLTWKQCLYLCNPLKNGGILIDDG
jgi:hypothetical protein